MYIPDNTVIKQSTWNEFVGKNPDNPQGAFEALCRLLFRNKFGIADSLPYFYNNAGNETLPVKVGRDTVGFQSKFFSGNTIDDSQAKQIKHSIETAHSHYPEQNKLIVYTNLAFGNPKGDETKTALQKDIEKTAADNQLSIEWKFGDNILDIVDQTPLARALFFDLNDNLQRLPASVKIWNDNNYKDISAEIAYKGQTIQIDRRKEIAELKELLAQRRHVLIHGESGSGKSAVVKQFWQETKNTPDSVLLMLKGIDFDARSVNDLFNFDESYTYAGFRDFYDGHSSKILVIDSAEKLTEFSNHTVLRLLLDGLGDTGWQFIFTCKSNSSEELHRLLKDLSVQVSDMKVDILSESALTSISVRHSLSLPTNQKVLHQIRIPFYLARYCELESDEVASPEAFREQVWEYKVRGRVRGGNQQRREQCLTQIVQAQLKQSSYYVNPVGLDHDSAYLLVQEDVLTTLPHKGYAVKHDLYVDWTLDYILEQDFSTIDKCLSVLKDVPQSITYSNAFSRWLDARIDTKDQRINAIMDAYVNGQVSRKWEHTLLVAIGKSESYAADFFSQYDSYLKANKFALFEKFVDILDVSCKVATSHFEYKGEIHAIYSPIGSGWNQAVRFVYDNKDTYYLDNLGTVLKLLKGYSKAGNKAVEMPHAAQLSLLIHEIVAQKRINNEDIWTDHLKPWSALVCSFAWGIRKELKSIFQQVISNQWIRNDDPYYELVEYVLTDEDNLGKSMLYLSCLEETIGLMRLFWQEHPENKKDRLWHRHDTYGRGYVFALNEEFGMDMAYFPASPNQTPVGSLLSAEELLDKDGLKTLDFIIDFTDNCVKAYSKRDTLDDKTVFPVRLLDGSRHEIIASQSLWNLYRGTQSYSIPHLLESYHMALEAHLLREADNKQQEPDWEKVKTWLWRILNNSHSVSLYAIVASIATAHPVELFDVVLFVCQDIRFISYDLTRFTCEMMAGNRSITFHRHELWRKERQQSNSLPHRQLHLERVLLDLQYKYDNEESELAKTRLATVYSLVDQLRSQADKLSDKDRTLRFIKERINYRGYDKKDVVLKGGVEAVMLTPTFSEDMKEESKRASALADRLGAISLRVWADKKFKRQEGELKGNQFVGNPKLALDAIREIEKQGKSGNNNYLLLPGDAYVPYMASAVLLMFHQDILTDSEKKECWERVLMALNDPRAMISNTLSELNICIAAIPTMLDIYPEREEDLLPVIAGYATIKNVYIDRRVCDMLSSTILDGKLWEERHALMDKALVSLKNHIPGADYEAMDADSADAVLCLLTCQPPEDKRSIGNICIDKLSDNWANEEEQLKLMDEYHIAENVTNYILFAPMEDVGRLMTNYVPVLRNDEYCKSLLGSFVINAAQWKRFNNFWKVWDTYYDKVKKLASIHSYNTLLNTYLLNPDYLNRDYDDWFTLEAKDMAFFERAAEDLGGSPETITALSRVFATIGKPFTKQSIDIFNTIITKYHPSIDTRRSYAVFYLEKVIKIVMVNNETDIRTDTRFKEKFVAVLEFLRDNGSTVASDMINNL